MNKNTIISVVVLLAVIIAGAMILKTEKNKDEDTGQKVLNNNDSSGLIVGRNAVNINEQALGKTANVSLVVLEKNGYVAVHEIVDGKPGKILGASALLLSGQSNNVKFQLSTVLKANTNYMAMLHLDDGDGVFNPSADLPARDGVDAIPIMMEFQASVNGGTDVKSI